MDRTLSSILATFWLVVLALVAGASKASGGPAIAPVADPSALSSSAATTTFYAVADAGIYSAYPDTNRGGDVNMWVAHGTNYNSASLVRFNLSTLPSNAIIDSATLEMYMFLVDEGGNDLATVNIGAYRVTSSWVEGTVTWNTAPTADPVGTNSSVNTSFGWKGWNVTSFARSWQSNPAQNYGLLLYGPLTGSDYNRSFDTKESGTSPYLYVTYHTATLCETQTQIPQAECQALVDLYNGTGGSSWTNKSGWAATTTPCSWYGVTCYGGHVDRLQLQSNHLAGNIPSSLSSLSHMTLLWLQQNQLAGNIPSIMGSLSNMDYLNLSQNQFTGGIPTSLCNLSGLTWLYLEGNQLSSGIPQCLGAMPDLAILDLSANQLNGSIPEALGNATLLQQLSVGANPLTGGIPSHLGNLNHLQWLDLYQTQITGNVPSSLGNLTALTHLRLDSTRLGGALPQALTNLRALSTFYFDNTNLCEPSNAAFQSWLAGIAGLHRTNVKCSGPTGAFLPAVAIKYRPFGSDEFSATVLDARWSWIFNDPSRWSLSARPAYLRILTDSGDLGLKNLALQMAPYGDFDVRIRLLFVPTGNYQAAGIVLYQDRRNYLFLARAYCDTAPPACVGNGIYFYRTENNVRVGSNFATSVSSASQAFLRVVRQGNTYTAYASTNGSNWTLVGSHTPGGGVSLSRVGLTAAQDLSDLRIPADFDYIRFYAAP